MKKQHVWILLLLWAALTLSAWFVPAKAMSASERRPLAQRPQLSLESLAGGSFMTKFEEYSVDQFPLRDGFRSVKALFHQYVLGQKDNNGIYLHNGYAAKQEYPLNTDSVDHALERLNYIYEKYLTDSQVYLALVPDKGYYLAQEAGQLAMDYEALFDGVKEGTPWAQFVDLTDLLHAEAYYRTDTHWRQEKLLDVAERICGSLGATPPDPADFTQTLLERPFYGVYYGQAALPMAPDELYLMESQLLSGCTVTDHETGKTTQVYDRTKLDSRDLYDVYLSGAKALLTIENPKAETDRELLIFRDSFGSSLAPLLVQGYAKVTLVDTRYIHPDLLDQWIEFKGQDVLMVYSTLILNGSSAMK